MYRKWSLSVEFSSSGFSVSGFLVLSACLSFVVPISKYS